MFSKDMSDWFDGFDSDQPVSDGAWANAWSPVWDDAPVARPAAATAHDVVSAHVVMSREVQPAQRLGGALNNG